MASGMEALEALDRGRVESGLDSKVGRSDKRRWSRRHWGQSPSVSSSAPPLGRGGQMIQ